MKKYLFIPLTFLVIFLSDCKKHELQPIPVEEIEYNTDGILKRYYIDFASGDDSNDGLSTETPWKRCPGMQGVQSNPASHQIAPGDAFIFKGGVELAESASVDIFPVEVSESSGFVDGTQENPIYFTYDEDWYIGSIWTKSVFNSNNLSPSFFDIKGLSNYSIAGFGMENHKVANSGDGAVNINESERIVVYKCFISNWVRDSQTDQKFGGIIVQSSDLILIEECNITGNTEGDCGAGIYMNQVTNVEISFCRVYNLPNGIQASGRIHDCYVYNINASFDDVMPENAVEVYNDCEIYNNVINDVEAGSVVYMACDFDESVSGVGYFYNNVVYNCVPVPLRLNNNNTFHIYNNTLIFNGASIVIVNNGSDPVKGLYIKNNILNNTSGSGTDGAMSLTGSVISYAEINYNNYFSNNADDIVWMLEGHGGLTLLQAQDLGHDSNSNEGYPLMNATISYKPLINQNDHLINKGVDLSSVFSFDITNTSRPQNGAWDIGHFEQ
ncbi:MAG: right-handed parallel beta-helix repeat-containing protein [bacterium]|nr:right-handed parallel beta-helix repeat-containing protein [bacterium]